MALSLVSLNINWDVQLKTVEPFLRSCNADVVLLQEVLDADVPKLQEMLGMDYVHYSPSMRMQTARGLLREGEAIFSRYPLIDARTLAYAGKAGPDYPYSEDPSTWDGGGYEQRALTGASITKEGIEYRFFTTHFTWTKDGEATDAQQDDMRRMLALLKKEEPFVLAGDFNAPRGFATFALLAKQYQDNIPDAYETSIDVLRHRSGQTQGEHLSKLMVDGLFTSFGFETTNVKLTFGVSDHAAIEALVERV